MNDLGARRDDWIKEKIPFDDLRTRVETYVKERGWLG